MLAYMLVYAATCSSTFCMYMYWLVLHAWVHVHVEVEVTRTRDTRVWLFFSPALAKAYILHVHNKIIIDHSSILVTSLALSRQCLYPLCSVARRPRWLQPNPTCRKHTRPSMDWNSLIITNSCITHNAETPGVWCVILLFHISVCTEL